MRERTRGIMSGEVKPIDKRTVHQICSGQVVLSLAVAVKELVENSLDAGATSIEVKLKDHGLELVEVSDNGCGVDPANFAALTLKHHTSKLSEFDDLLSVSTFGFRGEALSSLCALSDLEVTTCNKAQSVATRIQYDSNGHIKSQTRCAREVGTTVSLHNLFHSLPVRYKEFQRNIKKEFSRMVHMLQGYCLISTGVRILCSNQIGKGKRQVVLATTGASSVRDNIVSVFGQKQLQSCVELRECGREEVEEEERGEGRDEELDPVTKDAMQLFRLSGYVSRCNHGCGRSATDRQFYYCNGRPIELPRLSKAVNEVYHMYNRHQNPCVVLNITINRECVDVNVTPDKRKVILQQEKSLLLLVKASLHKIYHPMQAEYEASTIGQTTQGVLKSAGGVYLSGTKSLPTLTRAVTSSQDTASDTFKERFHQQPPPPKQPKLKLSGVTGSGHSSPALGLGCELKLKTKWVPRDKDVPPASSCVSTDVLTESVISTSTTDHDSMSAVASAPQTTDGLCISLKTTQSYYDNGAPRGSCDRNPTTKSPPSLTSVECRREHSVACDLTAITHRLLRARTMAETCGEDGEDGENGEGMEDSEGTKMRFRAKIRPGESQSAEDELRKEISLEMFDKMEVVGQFNLGFIITQLADNLFIIDQHATDEKFNFERLQREAVIDNQTLIIPKPLELTPVSEGVVMDNLDVFKMNGFQFHIDLTAPPTKRLSLTSHPVYRGWKFDSDEIEEMIFLLSDNPGDMVRPSKVRQMFASRACRTSVMIGTALSRAEMKRLVSNMAQQKLPWNCPHGRPTLRHLVDLSRL